MKSINQGIIPYLEKCKKKEVKKAIGLITDKQNIFQEIDNVYLTHDEAIRNMERRILPNHNSVENEYRIVYYFADLNRFIFYVPNSINENQFVFLIDLFEKLEEAKKNSKIEIVFICKKNDIVIDENTSLDSIKEQLSKLKGNYYSNEKDENVIGEELPSSTIIQNITKVSGTNQCYTAKDLEKCFACLLSLYRDDYYKKYIEELFPKFSIFTNLSNFNFLEYEDEINQRLQNVSNRDELFDVLSFAVSCSLTKDLLYLNEMVEKCKYFADLNVGKEYEEKIKSVTSLIKQLEKERNDTKDLDMMLTEENNGLESDGIKK